LEKAALSYQQHLQMMISLTYIYWNHGTTLFKHLIYTALQTFAPF
jgi:hypothetical protein